MTDEERTERTARRFWVGLVVLLLGIQVAIGGVALRLATADSSVAVIPDYHNRALNWDSHHRRQTAANRLGWTVEIAASDVADASGGRALTMTVKDADGTPLDSLSAVAQIYHHASASRVDTVALNRAGEGRYIALAPMAKPGLWELEIDINGGPEPVTQRIVLKV